MNGSPPPSDLLGSILALIGRAFFSSLREEIMATLQELEPKVDALQQDITDAATRSIAFAADMHQQIADLRAQLEAQQVPPELLTRLDEMDQTVKGIDPTDPTQLPTPPPVPAPTPSPEPVPPPETDVVP